MAKRRNTPAPDYDNVPDEDEPWTDEEIDFINTAMFGDDPDDIAEGYESLMTDD